jgi:hypothetical protein
VIAWVRRLRETGSVGPGKIGGHKPKAIAGEHPVAIAAQRERSENWNKGRRARTDGDHPRALPIYSRGTNRVRAGLRVDQWPMPRRDSGVVTYPGGGSTSCPLVGHLLDCWRITVFANSLRNLPIVFPMSNTGKNIRKIYCFISMITAFTAQSETLRDFIGVFG